MRKFYTIIWFVLISVTLSSQSPQKMSYQAIVRNSSNVLVTSSPIGMRISILKGSPTGIEIFKEIYNPNPQTNTNGLVTVEVGGGIPVVGVFSIIDWSSGTYFIKTEIDPTGGTNYTITGTSQLLSVPYALHAKTAESISGGITETDPIFVAHAASGVTSTFIGNWNTAFAWGNHSGLYRPISYIPSWSTITSNPFSFISPVNNQLLKYNTTTSKWENWTPNFLTAEVDGSITNEIQTLSLSTFQLSISGAGGNTVNFTNWDTDKTDDVTITGIQTITGDKTFAGTTTVPTPINALSATTKAYVDASIQNQIFLLKNSIAGDGMVKDYENNKYNTIKIGAQVWMAENLKTITYNDGTSIPLILEDSEWAALTTPAYCWPSNDIINKNTYGALYNWYTVATGKLCPIGWHIPSEAEWIILTDYLTNNGYGYQGSGDDIAKSLSVTFSWYLSSTLGNVGNNQESNNRSGFTATGAGIRYYFDGSFLVLGQECHLWSSLSANASGAYQIDFKNETSTIRNGGAGKASGLSVRCLKD